MKKKHFGSIKNRTMVIASIFKKEKHQAEFDARFPTTDAKLSALVRYMDTASEEAIEQSGYLKTIKNVMVFLAILVIIGIIFQGCSSLGL